MPENELESPSLLGQITEKLRQVEDLIIPDPKDRDGLQAQYTPDAGYRSFSSGKFSPAPAAELNGTFNLAKCVPALIVGAAALAAVVNALSTDRQKELEAEAKKQREEAEAKKHAEEQKTRDDRSKTEQKRQEDERLAALKKELEDRVKKVQALINASGELAPEAQQALREISASAADIDAIDLPSADLKEKLISKLDDILGNLDRGLNSAWEPRDRKG